MDNYTKQLETALENYQSLLSESEEFCDSYESNIKEIYQMVKRCMSCLEYSLKEMEDLGDHSDRYLNNMDSISYGLHILDVVLSNITDLIGNPGEKDGS